MKRRKALKLIIHMVCILGVLFLGLTVVQRVKVALAEPFSNMNLKGTNVTGEDAVRLTWDAPNKNEPYTYKVFSKKPLMDSFQTISSVDLTEQVKVLNVYPEAGNHITYTTWDGTTRTISKSASAEKWMEEPNQYNAKGFGMGLIDVTPVEIASFNTSPSTYLKNTDGSWKYDVVLIGSWDSNGGKGLDVESSGMLIEFIKSGRGVIIGHDTVGSAWQRPAPVRNERKYTHRLLEHMNIETVPEEFENVEPVDLPLKYQLWGSDEVVLTKKGLLSSYPWDIGEVGAEFNVPYSHTAWLMSKGDRWVKYKNVKNISANVIDRADEYMKNENPEMNAYLSTWNNTAMIQTGHSNGNATTDEQKILANTLFYLSQLTTDTNLTDRSAMDATPPKFKTTEHTIKRVNGNVTIDFSSAEDVDAPFEYYVEATGQNTGNKLKSEIIKVNNTSGISGYATVVDNSPSTVPDNKVNTTTTTVTTPKEVGKPKYLHVVAIDKKGNKSEPQHIKLDNSPPTMTITISTKDWTSTDITLNVKMTDEGSGLHTIEYNGVTTNLDGTNQGSLGLRNFKQNGTTTFTLTDKAGNVTKQDFTINNIDKEKPTLTTKLNPTGWTNKNVEITATGSDKLSGVKNVRMEMDVNSNSKNVVAMGNISNYKLTDSTKDGTRLTYSSDGSDPYTGLAIDKEIIKPNEYYVLSYDITKLSGSIPEIGGHVELATKSEVYIDGKQVTKTGTESPYHDVIPYPNDTKKHHVTVKIYTDKYATVGNKNIYIQPNRRLTGHPFSVVIENIQLEKGTEETPYEPNYKDVLTNINPLKVNVSDNGTYSFIVTDIAGNEYKEDVKLTTIDKTPPKVVLEEGNTSVWSKDKTITIKAEDSQSGVKHIVTPDGTVVKSTTEIYTITDNGNNLFKVVDNAGNETLHTVNVNRIDNEKPTIDTTYMPKSWTNNGITVDVGLTDRQSGLAKLELPDGKVNYLNNVSPTDITEWEYGHYHEASNQHTNYGSITLPGRIRTKPSIFLSLQDATELKVEMNNKYYLGIYYYTRPIDTSYMAGTRVIGEDVGNLLKLPTGAKYARISVFRKDGTVVPVTQQELDIIGLTLTPNKELDTYSTKYAITKNGTYVFKALDNAGNEEVKTLNISNIDKTAPSVTIKGNPTEYIDEDSISLAITATDTQSGVKSITLPDGKVVSAYSTTYKVRANGSYKFTITDNVGNSTIHTEKVDKLKINYTFYLNDSKGKPLQGAGFDLMRNGVKVADAESDVNGLVNFGKVPADGKYTVKQTKAPDGYVVNPDEKDVEVGDTTEPEEFISYPRGDLLPATGTIDTIIQGIIIIGLTCMVVTVTVRKKRQVK